MIDLTTKQRKRSRTMRKQHDHLRSRDMNDSIRALDKLSTSVKRYSDRTKRKNIKLN
jgi:hypothetical protein